MSAMRTIPCERSGGRTAPYQYTNFVVQNLVFAGVGTAINSVFPVMRRVARLELRAEAAVFSLSLSSSIVNATLLDTVGVFVGVDDGPELVSVAGGVNLFLSHIARQNSLPGLPASSSRTNTVAFGEMTAYRLASGRPLALYACSANAADNELSAVLSIYWAPVL